MRNITSGKMAACGWLRKQFRRSITSDKGKKSKWSLIEVVLIFSYFRRHYNRFQTYATRLKMATLTCQYYVRRSLSSNCLEFLIFSISINVYTLFVPEPAARKRGARVTNSEMRKSSAIMCRIGLVWVGRSTF